MLLFEIVKYAPSNRVTNRRCYLVIDNWDDYHYKTLFELYYSNANGEIKKIGGVKIGKVEMLEKGRITNHLEPTFPFLPDGFFLWDMVKITMMNYSRFHRKKEKKY